MFKFHFFYLIPQSYNKLLRHVCPNTWTVAEINTVGFLKWNIMQLDISICDKYKLKWQKTTKKTFSILVIIQTMNYKWISMKIYT